MSYTEDLSLVLDDLSSTTTQKGSARCAALCYAIGGKITGGDGRQRGLHGLGLLGRLLGLPC